MPSESANKSAVCGECGRPISNESLKPKQVKLYRFIREYFDANQCAPSLTEMAESMGISTATARSLVRAA
ncbi:MAG: hypothetical protein IPK83_18595 [Planctomycetes bacterium]|nr:hypothetical protein [Planctomycetota bacterium]